MNRVRVGAAVGLTGLLAGAAGADTLYGIGTENIDGSSNLYRIDDPLGSPTAVNIGEAGGSIFDIAISPVTGKAYGITTATLFSIDLATGQASPIGNGLDISQNALEFTPDGTLYSWGIFDTRLFRVDPATGQATPLFDLHNSSGGDLAAVSNTLLYGTTGTDLIEIDIANGTEKLIGPHGDALGGSVLYGLEMGSDGELVGLIGAAGGQTRLFRIDRQTGAASLIGDIAGAEALGGYGLAYAVPGPGGLGLLGLGGLAVGRRRR